MSASEAQTTSRAKERLKWIAPIGLALLVVCVGCFFFFAIGLTARGELTTSVAGTDFRLWAISQRQQSGVGLQRTYPVPVNGQCLHAHGCDVLLLAARAVDRQCDLG